MISSFFKSIFSFTSLISLTVLAIAGSAGYFSIYGLVLIFSGAVIPVMIMAGSLEVGKLVLTSILFNYWRKMNILLTFYCVIAILCLMVITSVGIYGFLSSAYQTNQAPLAQINKRIELLDQEFERKNARLLQMDKVVEAIPSAMVNSRLREKRQQDPERKMLQARIIEIEKEKLEISNSQLETEVHLGPIVKIAEAFGVTKDRAVHLLIMLFIFVFDPLAVALTLCVNVVISERNRHKSTDNYTHKTADESSDDFINNEVVDIKLSDNDLNQDIEQQSTMVNLHDITSIPPEDYKIQVFKEQQYDTNLVTDIVSNPQDPVPISIDRSTIAPIENCITDVSSTSDDKVSNIEILNVEKVEDQSIDVDQKEPIDFIISQLGEKIEDVKKQFEKQASSTNSLEEHKARVLNNIHQGK